MEGNLFVGVDLGGTTIKIGLVNDDGQLIFDTEVPTRTKDGQEAIIEDIVLTTKQIVKQAGFEWDNVKGMGFGIPGLLNIAQGIVSLAPNLDWVNIPLKEILEEKLHIPIKIDNDANVAVLGEAWTGAGKGFKHLVMATIGTGIGGGIIIEGNILHGKNGMAAELGHIPISDEGLLCGCGNYGCLETISSATGIVRKGKQVVEDGKVSILTEKYMDKIDQITARRVIDAAKEGDKEAEQIVQNAGNLLGQGLATVANLLDPEIIIVGGGVSKAGDIIFDPIKEGLMRHGLKSIVKSVKVVPAVLGNNAGMIGAASLFRS